MVGVKSGMSKTTYRGNGMEPVHGFERNETCLSKRWWIASLVNNAKDTVLCSQYVSMFFLETTGI